MPTYDRIRKGIMSRIYGKREEIDIENLLPQEKWNLIERLVRVAEEYNEKFLLKLKERMDRVGIDNPTIQVKLYRWTVVFDKKKLIFCVVFFEDLAKKSVVAGRVNGVSDLLVWEIPSIVSIDDVIVSSSLDYSVHNLKNVGTPPFAHGESCSNSL
ncbi:hypothetical protein Sjap_008083 [Stephania japonica]|uniref:Uncharacterized protein n=1 Tax=Stephania japonica TaxID=461633 RepID=A0AAP0JP86_9MAGN